MSKKKYKKSHKYAIKAKVKPGNTSDCIKWWRTSNLIKFVAFLDKHYPDWTWFNVWDKKTWVQLNSYTKNNRPSRKYVS